MVKSSPMLMSSPMVKAYLAGLKTETRRTRGLDLINTYPDGCKFIGLGKLEKGNRNHIGKFGAFFELPKHLWIDEDKPRREFIPAPYGGAGDTLWFKETYAIICNLALPLCPCESEEEEKANHFVEYRADTDNKYPGDWPEEEAQGNDEAPKWRPSIFMNRAYSRFVDIPIEGLRVERLKEITEAGAFSEGVEKLHIVYGNGPSYRDTYFELWNHLNGKKMPVERNPWVWVYEFPRHQKEVSS